MSLLFLEKKSISQMWWHMHVVPATQEGEVGGSSSEAILDKSVRPYLKNKLKQKDWCLAQVVECLFEALSSISRIIKRRSTDIIDIT
jgi:hypothetical protein